jgi:hypothetical protein
VATDRLVVVRAVDRLRDFATAKRVRELATARFLAWWREREEDE